MSPWPHCPPAPSNVNTHRTYDLFSSLWLCGCPDQCHAMQGHLLVVYLGKIPKCFMLTCLRALTALSSHTTPSIKILVKSRHTCNPHAMGVVSVRFAYMSIAVSSPAAFIISPLLSGQEYLGPFVNEGSDLCACNTVTYSLISGCGACQSATWIEYDSPRLLLPPLPTCHQLASMGTQLHNDSGPREVSFQLRQGI